MFARCLCFSLIAVITTIASDLRADGVSRGYTSTQTTATGGGGESLDSALSELLKKKGEPQAQAMSVSRGFTSTQTTATGGGGGSMDRALADMFKKISEANAKAAPVPRVSNLVPMTATGRQKSSPTEHLNPVQPTLTSFSRGKSIFSKSVRDERSVAPRNIFVLQNLKAKTLVSNTLEARNNQPASPVVGPQLSGSHVAGTQVSPLRIAL